MRSFLFSVTVSLLVALTVSYRPSKEDIKKTLDIHAEVRQNATPTATYMYYLVSWPFVSFPLDLANSTYNLITPSSILSKGTMQHLLTINCLFFFKTWDKHLENLAVNWSNRCVYEHPDVHKFPEFFRIGQNIMMWYSKPDMASLTWHWYREEEDYDFKTNTCKQNKQCGHYKQVSSSIFKV